LAPLVHHTIASVMLEVHDLLLPRTVY